MIYYVYKTTNIDNGKYYIGAHSAKSRKRMESYLGSGKELKEDIKKLGKNKFTKEIIKYCASKEEALQLEKALITPELLKDEFCYNVAFGGRGGDIFTNPLHPKYEEVCRNISTSKLGKKNNSWNTGLTKETSTKLAEIGIKISRAKKGKPSSRKGVKCRPLSEQSKQAIREGLEGKSYWFTNGVTNVRGSVVPGLGWRRGRTMSPSLYNKFCKKLTSGAVSADFHA